MDDVNLNTPIACTLSNEQRAKQTKDFHATLSPHVLSSETLLDGAWISFRNIPSVRESLRQLVALDDDCCKFLDHRIEENAHQIILITRSHGEGIPLAQQFIAELAPGAGKAGSNFATKTAVLLGLCGVACLTPVILGITGIGAVGVSGMFGGEVLAVTLAILLAVGYVVARQRKPKEKKADANRCGC